MAEPVVINTLSEDILLVVLDWTSQLVMAVRRAGGPWAGPYWRRETAEVG